MPTTETPPLETTPTPETPPAAAGWRTAASVALPMLAALVLCVLFDALGSERLNSYWIANGALGLPDSAQVYLWLSAAAFGLPAALLFAIGLARWAPHSRRVRGLLSFIPSLDDLSFVVFAMIAAFTVPAMIRAVLLAGAPIADDESAYQFGAQLLARGRLWVSSPPEKLFFDRPFMVNDGRLYPMYFLGWPLLMAPGVPLGFAGYMNAVYSALTVPAVHLAARELGGRTVARGAVALFVLSPMVSIAAATQMSNTSCLFALAWATACWARARHGDARLGWHVGVGAFLGLALLVRPSSTLGIGLPVALAWCASVLAGPRDARVRRVLAAAVPGLAACGLLLLVNKLQNGAWLLTSYERELQYAKENGLRFTNWSSAYLAPLVEAGKDNGHFASRGFYGNVATAAVAWLRTDGVLFGWVPTLLFALFGVAGRAGLLLAAMVAGHFVVHWRVLDVGIDTYGAHHYFELVLPLVLLTALGVQALGRWLALHPSAEARLVPRALLVGLTLFALVQTAPPRARALLAMGDDANLPRDMLAVSNIHRAVVFSPMPFTKRMNGCARGSSHFVGWRPNSDPWLEDDILWVNHVGVEEDRRLMEHFPGRQGVVLYYDAGCRAQVVPLSMADDAAIGRGNVDGHHAQLPRNLAPPQRSPEPPKP